MGEEVEHERRMKEVRRRRSIQWPRQHRDTFIRNYGHKPEVATAGDIASQDDVNAVVRHYWEDT